MTATVLFIGDPHIQVTNIPEFEVFLERLRILALDKQPDLIVIGGDLLHTHERLHTTALNKAYEFVEKMRCIAKTYVLVGNHDMCNNQQFLTENHWMGGMKEWNNVVIVDLVVTETIKDEKFVFTPYVYPGRFVEALDTLEDGWQDASCIFAHQEFFGCKMGAIVSSEGDKWPLTNPQVVSGHIHSRQMPQENIYYTGSAMQHAFGESEKNIIAFLTFSGGRDSPYAREEIDLALPRKKIVYMDVENIDDYEVPETEDKLKLTVSGVYEQFKTFKKTEKYKKLVDKGVKVVFKPNRLEIKKGFEDHDNIVSSNVSDFNEIITSLIMSQKHPKLYQAFELIMNNKHIDTEDIMFI